MKITFSLQVVFCYPHECQFTESNMLNYYSQRYNFPANIRRTTEVIRFDHYAYCKPKSSLLKGMRSTTYRF